ncbi:hypothetical protein BCR44DRAFT_1431200 [Catenaria anguillulae PL171]|uniref:GATA-type domain-containing protein n=1 Tax=Catenaria anguillulae PL171 TaxID=765915 RepID=A0A1Y2HQT6_9FUNG|nr:hypothetical protein BCR44DRAFT_1431200 [Catenaria anguillulae PL171]
MNDPDAMDTDPLSPVMAASSMLEPPTSPALSASASASPSPAPQQQQPPLPMPPMPAAAGGTRCVNCYTSTTPLWRRTPDNAAVCCNACGLFFRHHGQHRPITDEERRANLLDTALPTTTATTDDVDRQQQPDSLEMAAAAALAGRLSHSSSSEASPTGSPAIGRPETADPDVNMTSATRDDEDEEDADDELQPILAAAKPPAAQPQEQASATAENNEACPGHDNLCNGQGGHETCVGCPTLNTAKLSESANVCSNCGTTTTPLWRRDTEAETFVMLVVSINLATGLYFRLHGKHRPIRLRKTVIKRRKRLQSSRDSEPPGPPPPNVPTRSLPQLFRPQYGPALPRCRCECCSYAHAVARSGRYRRCLVVWRRSGTYVMPPRPQVNGAHLDEGRPSESMPVPRGRDYSIPGAAVDALMDAAGEAPQYQGESRYSPHQTAHYQSYQQQPHFVPSNASTPSASHSHLQSHSQSSSQTHSAPSSTKTAPLLPYPPMTVNPLGGRGGRPATGFSFSTPTSTPSSPVQRPTTAQSDPSARAVLVAHIQSLERMTAEARDALARFDAANNSNSQHQHQQQHHHHARMDTSPVSHTPLPPIQLPRPTSSSSHGGTSYSASPLTVSSALGLHSSTAPPSSSGAPTPVHHHTPGARQMISPSSLHPGMYSGARQAASSSSAHHHHLYSSQFQPPAPAHHQTQQYAPGTSYYSTHQQQAQEYRSPTGGYATVPPPPMQQSSSSSSSARHEESGGGPRLPPIQPHPPGTAGRGAGESRKGGNRSGSAGAGNDSFALA